MQSGVLNLDDASLIKKHLPELCEQDVFTSPPGSPFSFEKREREITLRMLLTHTSGVGYDMLDPRLQGWRAQRGEGPKALIGPVVDGFGVPLVFQPGEGWGYGGGLDWVGLLIERVMGEKLGTVLRREVFDVVGCDAGIGFSEEVEEKECVMVIMRGEDGGLKEWVVQPQRAQMGGGGLLASTRNYVRVLGDLVAEESKLLNREMLEALFKPQFKEGNKALDMLTSSPAVGAMAGPLTAALKKESLNHALGGILVTEDNEELGSKKGTMAWGGSFNCLWFANREAGVAGVYLSNLFPPGDAKSGELMAEFVKEVWRKAGS